MSEFHDPDLRREFARLSGPYPDDNAAFAAWQRRVGQARRRRAVAWTTGAALSVLLGTVGVAALNSPGRHTLVPAKSTDSSTDVSISTTTMVKESSTTVSTEPETSESTVVETTPITEPVETSVAATEVQAPAPAGGGSNSGSPKPHAPVTSAAPVAQVGTATFASVGGSITVRQDGTHLTVTAVNPAAGFHAGQDKQSGERVEVSFKSDRHETQITVKVVNGVMTPTISDHDDKHDSTVPDSTDGGGRNGGGGDN